jgi:hypothetical protein
MLFYLRRLQACRLANPSHVEVQMVFRGQMPQGHQQWDNNDGNNWQVGVVIRLCLAAGRLMFMLQR